jgi:hypothetical protein
MQKPGSIAFGRNWMLLKQLWMVAVFLTFLVVRILGSETFQKLSQAWEAK